MRANITQPNKDLAQYANRTYRGGIDVRRSRVDIDDISATSLINFDISVDGIRTKRREPKLVAVLNQYGLRVNGAAQYVDANGSIWTVWACSGKLYKWDGTVGATVGSGVTQYTVYASDGVTEAPLSTTNNVKMVQVHNKLYGVDGHLPLFVFDGTTAKCIPSSTSNLPIVPGSLVISWTGSGDTVTDVNPSATPADAGTGKLYLNSSGDYIGVFAYDTGVFSFISALPWSSTATVTAAWTTPEYSTTQTFNRVATDGTLICPALVHGDVKVGTLSLTDGTTVIECDSTTTTAPFGSGTWYRLVEHGTTTVKGSYCPATGQVYVNSAVFIASSIVTASYQYLSSTGPFYLETGNVSVNNPGVNYTVSIGDVPVKVVCDTPTPTQYAYLYIDSIDGSGGVTALEVVPSSPGSYPTAPATGTYTTEATSGQYGEGLTVDIAAWSGTPNYTTVTSEYVGLADGDGKFYHFVGADIPSGTVYCTLTDGTTTLTGDGAGNLKTSGGSTVGTFNSTTGDFQVTTASTLQSGMSVDFRWFVNATVSGVGVSSTAQTGTFGAQGVGFGATDILWWNDRLWIAVKNQILYSTAYAPEKFNATVPLSVSSSGTLRLIGSSYQRLIIFSLDFGARGEVFYADCTSNDTTQWKAVSIFGGLNFVAPGCILRAANNDSADCFYRTVEGVRSLKMTVQDKIAGPSLPFSENIRSLLTALPSQHLADSWAIMFDDEYLMFSPKDNDANTWVIHAYNLKVPRDNQQQGWTVIDMAKHMDGSNIVYGIEANCGCVADYGSGQNLYIGTHAGGGIIQMFGQDADAGGFTATAISKGIDFGERFSDTSPYKILERFGKNSVGTLTVSLMDDQDNLYSLGTITIETSGTKNFVRALDANITSGGTWGNELPASNDWRVVETTTDPLELMGFMLLAQSRKTQFVQTEESNPSAITQGAIVSEPVTHGAISS